VLGATLAARALDQNPAHGLGSGSEEMLPPIELLVTDQAEVRFVYQRRGLKRLAGGFGRHPCGGERPQLVVDERE